ncbi:MAG: hypothetical protein HUJ31_18900 [Pseudomonadales bacterium]|nr:hypothetical protein [Pseudomonadales bacterium]
MSKQDMNKDRLRQLVSTYGASPARWPEEEREAAARFVEANPEVREALSREAALDELLDTFNVDVPHDLRNRILARIHDETSTDFADRLIDWIIPPRRYLWRPVLAAMVPLVTGIVLGGALRLEEAVDDADIWQEEIYVMALNFDETETRQ